jgi:hypothetical protein
MSIANNKNGRIFLEEPCNNDHNGAAAAAIAVEPTSILTVKKKTSRRISVFNRRQSTTQPRKCSHNRRVQFLDRVQQYEPTYSLDEDMHTTCFYNNKEMQSFIKWSEIMVLRARKSLQEKADAAPMAKIKYHCRGLENLLTTSVGIDARNRRAKTIQTVLEEQQRQQRRKPKESTAAVVSENYHYSPEQIRAKVKPTTKASKKIALKLAKQDAREAYMEEPNEVQPPTTTATALRTSPDFRRASRVFAESHKKIQQGDQRRLSVINREAVAAFLERLADYDDDDADYDYDSAEE